MNSKIPDEGLSAFCIAVVTVASEYSNKRHHPLNNVLIHYQLAIVFLIFYVFVKAEMKKKYHEEQLPTFLDNLEKLLKANNGGDGFFVGSGVSIS